MVLLVNFCHFSSNLTIPKASDEKTTSKVYKLFYHPQGFLSDRSDNHPTLK